jgi:hypothetical protein
MENILLIASLNFGKHRFLNRSSWQCEVPCLATLSLISVLLKLGAYMGTVKQLSTSLRSHSLSDMPSECREPSDAIVLEDNPAGVLNSILPHHYSPSPKAVYSDAMRWSFWIVVTDLSCPNHSFLRVAAAVVAFCGASRSGVARLGRPFLLW